MQLATTSSDVALIDPLEPQTVGAEIASSILDNIESEVSMALSRRMLEGAKLRLQTINGDFERIIDEVKGNDPAQIELSKLYVEGCRAEIANCYLAVNRKIARTPEGHKRVMDIVDSLLAKTLERLDKAASLPLAQSAASSKKSKSRL